MRLSTEAVVAYPSHTSPVPTDLMTIMHQILQQHAAMSSQLAAMLQQLAAFAQQQTAISQQIKDMQEKHDREARLGPIRVQNAACHTAGEVLLQNLAGGGQPTTGLHTATDMRHCPVGDIDALLAQYQLVTTGSVADRRIRLATYLGVHRAYV